jgi:hypothetical protein
MVCMRHAGLRPFNLHRKFQIRGKLVIGLSATIAHTPIATPREGRFGPG